VASQRCACKGSLVFCYFLQATNSSGEPYALQTLSTPSARHKQLVAAIAEDMRLITVAECEGFRELLQVADLLICASSCPVVVILHRQFSLMSSSAYCSITTDLWTTKHQVRRYMGLTCHIIDVEWRMKSLVLTT